jgi:phosphatidylserine decarboxylase
MSSFKTSCLSRIFGKFASCKFPKPIQKIVNWAYIKMMEVDLSEFAPYETYESLNALFTRKLLNQRKYDESSNVLISPCDAFISEKGIIKSFQALQIKGFVYRIDELLGKYIDEKNKAKLEGGEYLNFYLSPKDYHRYHVPFDMQVTKAVHIPGKLYPVNFKWLRKVTQLFIQNERVVLECYTKEKKLFYMVFVGALNVGKMSFSFDDSIRTNVKANQIQEYLYKDLELKKGNELGHFEMGSTIVMFFEKEAFALTCNKDASIRFSQSIGTIL